jgi:RNA polymerase sigma-70 factor (ECF subfamily)
VNWDTLVEKLGPRLLRYFAATFSESHSADLVQETFLRLVRRYREGAFDPQKGNLVMFAYGIASFVRLEALKAKAREPGWATEHQIAQLSAPEEEGVEASRRLRNAIRELKEVEQQVVLLHIDQELSLVEIGGILRMPVGTVKSHIHRAKENLQRILEGSKNHERRSR